jgi:hypothetical protein
MFDDKPSESVEALEVTLAISFLFVPVQLALVLAKRYMATGSVSASLCLSRKCLRNRSTSTSVKGRTAISSIVISSQSSHPTCRTSRHSLDIEQDRS